ncbi:MAG: autotransporter domain-containing protein, partial [Geminicoccaceae bacterium]
GGSTAGGSSGKGGAVKVEVAAAIRAEGRDANAIMAQSVGKGGNGRIEVTVRGGSVIEGGSGLGTGVLVLDGADNLISVGGSVGSIAGIDGRAVVATTGDDFVVVDGALTGNVDLGAGANTLNINGSGRLVSGSAIAVGAGNQLTVFGTLSPGGDEVLKTTAVTGNLVQSGGNYLVTLDGKQLNRNDRVDVSGSADMTGTVEVRVVDAGSGTVQSRTTIVDAGAGVTPDTATHLTVKPSAVGNYGLVFDNSNKVDLTYAIDFLNDRLRAGLNDNQEAVAEALEGLHDAGAMHRDLLYLLQAGDADDYGDALDGLSPEPYAVSEWAAVLSSQQFSDSMMSCRERAGDYRFVDEGQCVRIGLQGRRFTRDDSSSNVGYDLDAAGVSIGAQKELAPGWHAGLGVAYEHWSADADHGLWRSDADQFAGGLVLKRDFGATLLAASVSGGFADVDVTRNVASGLQAKGDQNTYFAGGQFRVAHAFAFGSWYLKPRNDLSVTWVHSDDVGESGAGAANLDVEDESKTFVALQPALEVGGEVELTHGAVMRPRASIGLTHFLDDPSPTAQASFRDASSAAPGIDVTSDVDRTTLDLELGVDVISAGGVVLGLGGFAQRGSDTTNLGGGLRLSMAF